MHPYQLTATLFSVALAAGFLGSLTGLGGGVILTPVLTLLLGVDLRYAIGATLAQLAMQAKPNGGTLCIQTGGLTAANHAERIQAIRDTLARLHPHGFIGDRLRGQHGWTEVEGCPLYTNDDFALAAQQIADTLVKYPALDALIQTGGFAELAPDAYRAVVTPYKQRIADGSLVLIAADTLPLQVGFLREGLSGGQVGQRPFDMGYKAIRYLTAIQDGDPPPPDPVLTGLDICLPANVDTCLEGK